MKTKDEIFDEIYDILDEEVRRYCDYSTYETLHDLIDSLNSVVEVEEYSNKTRDL